MTRRQPLWIMYKNGIDEGTFSSAVGSWAAAAPLTNIKDPRPNRRARSTDLALENTQFLLELPAARSFRGALFSRTNFHQSGELRVTAHNLADLSDPVATTGWVTVGGPRSFDLEWENPHYWSGRVPRIDPDAKGLDVPVIFDAALTAKYWLCEFNNVAHEDGFFSVGRVYMGEVYQPTRNAALGATLRPMSSSLVKTSASGTPYVKRRSKFYQVSFDLQNLPQAEVLTNIMGDLVEICGVSKQVAVFMDPDAPALDDKLAFLGRFEELPEMKFGPADYKDVPITITGYP